LFYLARSYVLYGNFDAFSSQEGASNISAAVGKHEIDFVAGRDVSRACDTRARSRREREREREREKGGREIPPCAGMNDIKFNAANLSRRAPWRVDMPYTSSSSSHARAGTCSSLIHICANTVTKFYGRRDTVTARYSEILIKGKFAVAVAWF